MASALDTARSAASAARKRAREARVDQMMLAGPAGFAYGSAAKAGVRLPSVMGLGRHATSGLIAAAVAYKNPGGMIGSGALALATSGLALAGFELGSTGKVVGEDFEEVGADDDDDGGDDEPDETVSG